jgi:ankyrin repeat protein
MVVRLYITAALSGHSNIAEELIRRKADIDCKDTNGKTPIGLGLEQRQQDIIQLLLKHDAQTRGIMSTEWLDAYNRGPSDVVVDLSQLSCGMKSLQFLKAQHVKMSAETGLTRRLL